MNYPLISEYIEAIKSPKDNFDELSYLRPVLNDDGMPVMSVGGFAVVFKMENIETGRYYALTCFTKKQKGRSEAYLPGNIVEVGNNTFDGYTMKAVLPNNGH